MFPSPPMTPISPSLRVGTCSWKYDSWQGLVYRPEDRGNYLAAYARAYRTVEVDQWFWSLHGPGSVSLPRPADVAAYAAAVPDDFRFSVKMPNALTLTHYYQKDKSAPLTKNPHFFSIEFLSSFLERLAPLQAKLGPLMFQFEYLNKQKMSSVKAFYEQLDDFLSKCPPGYRFAVELRNATWLGRPFFELLAGRGVAPVFLEGYWMPPVWDLCDQFGDLVTGTAVVRLHGPDRQGAEERSGGSWDRLIDARDDDLPRIGEAVRKLLGRGVVVYLNVNNHFEGSAPLTIARLAPHLGQAAPTLSYQTGPRTES